MKAKTKKVFLYLKGLWPTVRNWLVKFLLKKLIPKLVAGPWGWLITFFGQKLFDKYVLPVWRFLTRKSYALVRKWQRKPKAKRLENANDENDFDSSVDDMP